MKLFTTLLFLASSALAFAQGPSSTAPAPTDTGVRAYHQSTTQPTANGDKRSRRYAPRRENTLFGDLDLSGLWGGPTYNYSATGDDWALVRGGFGGLELDDNVFIGYGGWSSRDPFTTDDVPSLIEQPTYDFRHGGFILAYSPGSDNTIHPRITTILGPGRIKGSVLGLDGSVTEFQERMFVGQLMAGAEINLFQWFRLGIEGGYRFASGVDVEGVTANDVSGAVVQIEARFGLSW
ncbi:hypothetical protein LEM8419_01551 [Neolewinella maritima]|uniref:Outer membrane protein beta-barrel domain-containing protein n=1 Tax=Neolewinella maritima TaxID=1383882 RepID=A0ABM9B0U3_9BACT|nr:hypothetical protein [Neolewinella maritima]CAH1000398.1 hypothetical protein LEM8419_01551 [Neolewinella maritima]